MRKTAIELKVCGMRDRDNILEVSRVHPDYMGFIFYEKSPRYVGAAFAIPQGFPAATRRVGVFVNESTQQILKCAAQFGLDYVQLHGDESVAQCEALRDNGLGIIKVFSVGDDMDFKVTESYHHAVDFFLFDTRGKYYGGNAQTFDWKVLARYDQRVPFFLSGGITPENVEGIKDLTGLNLRAIDVNSGVETRPAFKDVKKIEAVKAVLTTKL